ncbi:NmrA domain-containing protein [Trichoderma simmonsii]|nr:NmrA domain-containing protein [Trichoderma simmonsii]
MSKEREEQQGRTIVDAAKDARVQHFIYSSLIDVAKATNGKLANVYHFDSKAAVEQYARDAGIPATFFQPGFFMSNIPGQLLAQESPEKPWTLALPTPETAPFPMFDAEADTGKFVKAIILKRDEVLGKRVLGATAYQTPAEILADFKSAFPNAGKDAKFFSLPHEMFTATLKGQGMPDFAAEELLQNFRLMDEGGYYAGEKLDWSLSILEDKPTTWLEHLKAAKPFQGLN